MKSLLAIVEQGGYPDFTHFYESLGYKVVVASSMRKGLGLLKTLKPDVITAEFIYSPMYSARISNLESLFASLQRQDLQPNLLIFIEKDQLHHLQKLEAGELNISTCCYPVTQNDINQLLSQEPLHY
jgi:hypothetical protein